MEGIFNIYILKFYNRIENGIICFKKYLCKIFFFFNDLKVFSWVIVEKKFYRIIWSYKIVYLNIDERLILKLKFYMNM